MSHQQLEAPSLSKRLALEFVGWYNNLMKDGQSPPNAFTGVCGDERQFVCLLTPLNLERSDRLDFMIEVLRAESCKAFAHSMRTVREDGVECIDIYSGESGEYWTHSILLQNDGPILQQHGPDKTAVIFFQDLLNPDGAASEKRERLLALWACVKDQIMWR